MGQRQQHGGKIAETDVSAQTESKPTIRKLYVAPVLVEYGTIAKLTQGTRTRKNDGSNTRRQACL